MSREALAAAVIDRRNRLGLTQEQVAGRGAVSTATLRKIENATDSNYNQRTLMAVDLVLAWPLGTARDVLNGSRLHANEVMGRAQQALLAALPDLPLESADPTVQLGGDSAEVHHRADQVPGSSGDLDLLIVQGRRASDPSDEVLHRLIDAFELLCRVALLPHPGSVGAPAEPRSEAS